VVKTTVSWSPTPHPSATLCHARLCVGGSPLGPPPSPPPPHHRSIRRRSRRHTVSTRKPLRHASGPRRTGLGDRSVRRRSHDQTGEPQNIGHLVKQMANWSNYRPTGQRNGHPVKKVANWSTSGHLVTSYLTHMIASSALLLSPIRGEVTRRGVARSRDKQTARSRDKLSLDSRHIKPHSYLSPLPLSCPSSHPLP
jgi:hypothetical protein